MAILLLLKDQGKARFSPHDANSEKEMKMWVNGDAMSWRLEA